MLIKERWRDALVLSLLWAGITAILFCLLRDSHSDSMLWMSLLFSLLLMSLGLVVYLGGAVLLAGFNTMTEEERSRYNMKEVTSFMGIFLILLSFVTFLMLIFFVFIVVFIAAVLVMLVYVNISKRFKTNVE
ncbi:MAG: DUF3784 domain-containing protein [Methanomassiliicoccaceae archaeon]|nr:DUF3784 domain-containing protein [Methanomassiliicoccaceae archaeon]